MGDDRDLAIIRYDATGALLGVDRFGPASTFANVELGARFPEGSYVVGGSLCGDADIGFATLTHQGNCDAWAARLPSP